MNSTGGGIAARLGPLCAFVFALALTSGCVAAPAKTAAESPPSSTTQATAAVDAPQAKPGDAPAASFEPDSLTYDERRTQEMYRLVDKLRGTTDPEERRALQLQILPLAGGCVRDEPELLKKH